MNIAAGHGALKLWNMLKGERAGGNCINYTNVAY